MLTAAAIPGSGRRTNHMVMVLGHAVTDHRTGVSGLVASSTATARCIFQTVASISVNSETVSNLVKATTNSAGIAKAAPTRASTAATTIVAVAFSNGQMAASMRVSGGTVLCTVRAPSPFPTDGGTAASMGA
eukprot:CAMPEP_0172771536 /NCGR_PEP_ID=MMETSP1074-20121228/190745_1 /TAXON_ID=2916 /ORGANISM="Ceratium fusus, Strain PA161109" /LENGTH=131 /DNA_ID=CAMNT_0013607481 /DNA_START=41 /DNA_END=432 /DNA_ORIENTATION=-